MAAWYFESYGYAKLTWEEQNPTSYPADDDSKPISCTPEETDLKEEPSPQHEPIKD